MMVMPSRKSFRNNSRASPICCLVSRSSDSTSSTEPLGMRAASTSAMNAAQRADRDVLPLPSADALVDDVVLDQLEFTLGGDLPGPLQLSAQTCFPCVALVSKTERNCRLVSWSGSPSTSLLYRVLSKLQLQVEGHGLQHLLGPADNGPWVNVTRRGVDRLDRHRRRRAIVRRDSRSGHGRAGADPTQHGVGDAGLPPRGQPHPEGDGDRLQQRRNGHRSHHDHGRQSDGPYQVVGKPAGLSTASSRRAATRPRRQAVVVPRRFRARRSPTWRTGRSRSPRPRPTARPSSTRTSCCGSRPASAAPRR